ncbi:MAG: hypothetical protein NZ585_02930 [Chloracidobacterium sp.]|nr:hypothetical protein [Chloracidobacterium sp.]MDW8218821.1 hypothetical protein [Acidobacteriota bacterium]
MVVGVNLSFGALERKTDRLGLLIQICHYLGLPEVVPEAADIVLVERRPALPSRLAEPWLEWKGLTVRRRDDWLFFAYGAWQVAIDVARRQVIPLALPEDGDLSVSYACYSYLRLVLLFLLRRIGWFELHGGACVYEGQGYVFLGPSGSGKTSAILGLLDAGWRYVSDDALLTKQIPADGEDAVVYARAARTLFSVTTDGLQRFPYLRQHAEPRLQHAEKWVVNPHAVWPDRYEPMAKPKFLFFCQLHDAEETQVLPLPTTNALACLMNTTPWLALDRETAAAHLATYRRLAESCYSFTLLAGRDLLRCPSALATHLDAARLTQLHRAYG